jgi:hypothetical protein
VGKRIAGILLAVLILVFAMPARVGAVSTSATAAILVDADSGIVRATRQVSLSVSFSRKMCASVNRQFSERYLASWNLEDFQKRCREIYAEYPQSADITRAPGCIICQAPEIQPFYLEEKNVQM